MLYTDYKTIETLIRKQKPIEGHFPFKQALKDIIKTRRTTNQPNSISKRIQLEPEEFKQAIYNTSILIDSYIEEQSDKIDSSIIPPNLDVFAIKHIYFPNHLLDYYPYSHDCFTLNFIYEGSCTLLFEKQEIQMSEGNLCIIAPNSIYKIIPENHEAIILEIYVRKTTFDSIFSDTFSELGILSDFFTNIIYNSDRRANYLYFSTQHPDTIKEFIQNIFIETNYIEKFSNLLAINYLKIVFISILKDFKFEQVFYPLKNVQDENLYNLLTYIKEHYQTVTLNELAHHFNYNISYLSTLLKNNFNITFSSYLTHLKMSEAQKLLKHTNLTISQISELVGYTSPDHFTRVYKKYYGKTPSKARK